MNFLNPHSLARPAALPGCPASAGLGQAVRQLACTLDLLADCLDVNMLQVAEQDGGVGGNLPDIANMFGGVGLGAMPSGPTSPSLRSSSAGCAGNRAEAAAAAVDLASGYNGQASSSLKGRLPGFTAPGGSTNNCAAFVSACLEATGALPKGGGSASVSELRQKLVQQGWKKVSAQQAPKGSVWMTRPGQGSHTELVAAPGGKVIGSNNTRPGFQQISFGQKHDSSGEFYAPPGAA